MSEKRAARLEIRKQLAERERFSDVDSRFSIIFFALRPPRPDSRDFVEPVRRALTGETHRAILEIKERGLARAIDRSRPGVTGRGARTFKQFVHWRGTHPGPGWVPWKPG